MVTFPGLRFEAFVSGEPRGVPALSGSHVAALRAAGRPGAAGHLWGSCQLVSWGSCPLHGCWDTCFAFLLFRFSG